MKNALFAVFFGALICILPLTAFAHSSSPGEPMGSLPVDQNPMMMHEVMRGVIEDMAQTMTDIVIIQEKLISGISDTEKKDLLEKIKELKKRMMTVQMGIKKCGCKGSMEKPADGEKKDIPPQQHIH